MDSILKNKNCLVTGATGGIGKHIVKLLLKNQCNVFLTSKNNTNLKNFCESLALKNSKISCFAADLANTSQIDLLIKKVKSNFSSIDILINCAGVFQIKPIEKCDNKEFDELLNVNLKAPFLLSKAFSKEMKKKKWGRIINIGSSSSYSGFKNGTLYSSSKHGVLGLSRSLSSELKDYNVRVFCISPSSTQTDMSKISTDQDFKTFINPKEVAEVVIFAISFDSEMIVDEIRLNRMIMK